jgi:hypothetical protein
MRRFRIDPPSSELSMFSPSRPKTDLIVHSAKPLNAEPPLDRLRSAFLTKTADFTSVPTAICRRSMPPSTGSA